MDEFVCVTITSHPGEAEAAFKTRLVAFWSAYLRGHPDEYEKVFAEATMFETLGDRVTRQYMVEPAGLDTLEAELGAHRLAFDPIDRDDLYSKYEAAPPDWFQLDH